MKKINKKGELTTKNLITIIVLITSFVIILFLLFRLDLGAVTDKEICHNSVVLKSKAQGLVGELDCKTNYVCISGGGECEEISPDETINVNADNKEEIMKVIADEMADCWWMFGEGELAYLGTDFQGEHCAICSEIKFDSLIQDELPEITYLEFYNYLSQTMKSDTESYLRYLYESFNVESVQEINDKISIAEEIIDTKEKFVIVTGINPKWPAKDGKVFKF